MLEQGETKVTGQRMKQLDERLRSQYAQLSPQEQRIADFVFDHFDDLISYNSAELARLSGVSKATVSRLFRRLGYEKYKDMRDELRTLRQSGMPLTDNRDAVQGNTLLARHYKQEMANLTQWINRIDSQQLSDVIAALGSAKRVFIIGMRNAYPVALHLRQQLLQARAHVVLLPQPGQTLGEELVDITPDDMVVVMAFRRRPLDSVSAFDSYASAMSLVNLLANALLHETLSQGRQRIHQIADLYQHLDELEHR